MGHIGNGQQVLQLVVACGYLETQNLGLVGDGGSLVGDPEALLELNLIAVLVVFWLAFAGDLRHRLGFKLTQVFQLELLA